MPRNKYKKLQSVIHFQDDNLANNKKEHNRGLSQASQGNDRCCFSTVWDF
jgi:hypothetical protein